MPLLGIIAMALTKNDNPNALADPVHPNFAKIIVMLAVLTIGPFLRFLVQVRCLMTPVTQKPIAADQKWSPAAWPNAGGKIRLPAPKKDEKSINPTGKISQNVRFCFIKSLPS